MNPKDGRVNVKERLLEALDSLIEATNNVEEEPEDILRLIVLRSRGIRAMYWTDRYLTELRMRERNTKEEEEGRKTRGRRRGK